MLEAVPGLRPVSIVTEMLRRHRDFSAATRRTLERRVRTWQALHGAERDVIFRQEHPPGQQGLSDFTDANPLGVTIAGVPLLLSLPPRRRGALSLSVGVLRLAACRGGARRREFRGPGRRTSERIVGARRRTARASQRQSLGGIPQSRPRCCRRPDQALRGAVRPLPHDRDQQQPGVAHENGVIEASHGHLKQTLAQSLLLRGSSDFADMPLYRRFVAEIVGRANAGRRRELDIERPLLGALPKRRTADYEEKIVTVTSSGGFMLRRVFYTVPSRLIGHRLRVRLYDDRIECFLGGEPVLTLPRGRAPQGRAMRSRTVHVVDYRHVIHALRRKPHALLNLVYRDQLFPRTAFRNTWDALVAAEPPRIACRIMVGLLALAHERACEAELADQLELILAAGERPDLDALQTQFAPASSCLPHVTVALPSVVAYDALLSNHAVEVSA